MGRILRKSVFAIVCKQDIVHFKFVAELFHNIASYERSIIEYIQK